MNNPKIIEFYVKQLKDSDHLDNFLNEQILYGYINLIKYLIEIVFLKDYYTYDNLSSMSELKENKLLDLVYILTDKKIDVLAYKFEVYDEKNDFMISVNPERVFRAYLKNEFFHPITGRTLSLKEFNEELIPFFSTTDNFKLKVKQDRNVKF